MKMRPVIEVLITDLKSLVLFIIGCALGLFYLWCSVIAVRHYFGAEKDSFESSVPFLNRFLGHIGESVMVGFFLMVISIPALYFVTAGGKNSPDDGDWWLLVVVPIYLIGAEVAMLFLKIPLIFIHADWIPDLLITVFLAIVCFRRAYLWARFPWTKANAEPLS
jgi:hypothetical protein